MTIESLSHDIDMIQQLAGPIANTYKDLTLTLALAESCGTPMMTTAVAKQFFQAGITKFPDEDNQCLIKVLEDIMGTEVRHSQK